MNHLIVAAHPVVDSLTMTLARAYADRLEALGHRALFYDLYRMNFDPVLAGPELVPPDAGHPVPLDVARAQDDLRAADALTLVYPLWWMSMPAILKGFVDRVFARGFAYDSRDGRVHGLLTGKKAVLITLSGAPLSVLIDNGRWNAAEMLQDTHILRATGFDLVEHVHFDQVAPALPAQCAAEHLARVRSCARRHFAAT